MSIFKKTRTRRAFTLVELIVVIAIISILATLVIVRYAGKTDQAKVAAAKAQLSMLDGACIEFQTHCNRLPNSLRELIEKPGDCPGWLDGGYLKGTTVPKDPWNNEYVFRNDDGKIEIVSYGADGKQGGTGPATDLSSLGTSGNE